MAMANPRDASEFSSVLQFERAHVALRRAKLRQEAAQAQLHSLRQQSELRLAALLPQLEKEGWWMVFLFFILYHSLARLTSGNIVFISQYAREDLTSKVKPVEKHATRTEIIFSYVLGLTPLTIFAIINPIVCIVLLPLFLLIVEGNRYFKKWINGYTGDCLGCIEQLAEVLIMLTFVAIWKFM